MDMTIGVGNAIKPMDLPVTDVDMVVGASLRPGQVKNARAKLADMDADERAGRVVIERDGEFHVLVAAELRAGDLVVEEDFPTLNELHYDWQGNPVDMTGGALFRVPSAPPSFANTNGEAGMHHNAQITVLRSGIGGAVVSGQDVPQVVVDDWSNMTWESVKSISVIDHVNHIGISNDGFRRLTGFSRENIEWGLSTRLDDSGNWGGTDAMFEHLNSVVGNAPSPVVLHALGDSSPALRQRVAEWNAANGN